MIKALTVASYEVQMPSSRRLILWLRLMVPTSYSLSLLLMVQWIRFVRAGVAYSS